MNFPRNELTPLPPSLEKKKRIEKGLFPLVTSFSLNTFSFLGFFLKFAWVQMSQSPNYMRSPLDPAHSQTSPGQRTESLMSNIRDESREIHATICSAFVIGGS